MMCLIVNLFTLLYIIYGNARHFCVSPWQRRQLVYYLFFLPFFTCSLRLRPPDWSILLPHRSELFQ